jgi:hypothetical protein
MIVPRVANTILYVAHSVLLTDMLPYENESTLTDNPKQHEFKDQIYYIIW